MNKNSQENSEKEKPCGKILGFIIMPHLLRDFPGGSVVKNLPANAGDSGDAVSIPGSGISPERGNGNPLQYS